MNRDKSDDTLRCRDCDHFSAGWCDKDDIARDGDLLVRVDPDGTCEDGERR